MIPRYEATALGGGNDYCLEQDDDGPLCRDYDVEQLEDELVIVKDRNAHLVRDNRRLKEYRQLVEKREAALRNVMNAQKIQLAMYRTGNFGRGAVVLAKLEKARKALRDTEDSA